MWKRGQDQVQAPFGKTGLVDVAQENVQEDKGTGGGDRRVGLTT